MDDELHHGCQFESGDILGCQLHIVRELVKAMFISEFLTDKCRLVPRFSTKFVLDENNFK